jgi:hypothetical protein
MYEEFEEKPKDKHLVIYLNGNSSKTITLKLQKFTLLQKEIIRKFALTDVYQIRLFNSQGNSIQNIHILSIITE